MAFQDQTLLSPSSLFHLLPTQQYLLGSCVGPG